MCLALSHEQGLRRDIRPDPCPQNVTAQRGKESEEDGGEGETDFKEQ